MANRIKSISLGDTRLDPTSTEFHVAVYPDRLTSTTQIRGRVAGPHCLYATTVEVAYPLREQYREYEKYGTPRIGLRAIIPEPNFWDPVSPFLYQVLLELWQDGRRCDQVERTHALRQFTLGPSGLRWNGSLLSLRGVRRDQDFKEEAWQLRQAGYNTVLAPVASGTAGLWDTSDRLGFLMVGRITGKVAVSQAYDLREHPSCLGWLVTPEFLNQEPLRICAEAVLGSDKQLVGVELDGSLSVALPKVISFVACEESVLARLAEIKLPKLILRNEGVAGPQESDASPGILGLVDL